MSTKDERIEAEAAKAADLDQYVGDFADVQDEFRKKELELHFYLRTSRQAVQGFLRLDGSWRDTRRTHRRQQVVDFIVLESKEQVRDQLFGWFGSHHSLSYYRIDDKKEFLSHYGDDPDNWPEADLDSPDTWPMYIYSDFDGDPLCNPNLDDLIGDMCESWSGAGGYSLSTGWGRLSDLDDEDVVEIGIAAMGLTDLGESLLEDYDSGINLVYDYHEIDHHLVHPHTYRAVEFTVTLFDENEEVISEKHFDLAAVARHVRDLMLDGQISV